MRYSTEPTYRKYEKEGYTYIYVAALQGFE